MALLQEFETLLNTNKLVNVKSAQEHELTGKVDSIKILELLPLESFRCRLLIIEKPKGKAGVLIYADESISPDRQDISIGGTALSFKVFGGASTFGSIVSLTDQLASASAVEELALLHATNMKLACEVAGIKDNRDILLSGMSAVIIPTTEIPKPIEDDSVRAAIAFLFGEEGPLSGSVIFPEIGQDKLMEEVVVNGGRVVGRSANPDLNLTRQQLGDICSGLLGIVEERDLVLASDIDLEVVVKAFLANIPLLTGLYDLVRRDSETYTHKNLLDYIKPILEAKLIKLIAKPELDKVLQF